jgi:acetoin utilization deacetylase AcuC-like enzyme
MSLLLVSSPRFADHLNPVGHPERPERAEVMDAVADACRARGDGVIEPRVATDDDLLRVHTPRHVADISARRGRWRASRQGQC